MAFDFESARSAQVRYNEQSASHKLDAIKHRNLAEAARQAGNHAVERDHRSRVKYHEENSTLTAELSRKMQHQIEAAHTTEKQRLASNEAANTIGKAAADASRQAEAHSRSEADRAAAEDARQKAELLRRESEHERRADEAARQKAELDRIMNEAERRGRDMRKDRPGKEME